QEICCSGREELLRQRGRAESGLDGSAKRVARNELETSGDLADCRSAEVAVVLCATGDSQLGVRHWACFQVDVSSNVCPAVGTRIAGWESSENRRSRRRLDARVRAVEDLYPSISIRIRLTGSHG